MLADVFATPVLGPYTGILTFNTALKLHEVLYLERRNTIFGLSTDGEKRMTGRISPTVNRFEQVSKNGKIHISYSARQLYSVLQKVYSIFDDEEFYKQLTCLISYLC